MNLDKLKAEKIKELLFSLQFNDRGTIFNAWNDESEEKAEKLISEALDSIQEEIISDLRESIKTHQGDGTKDNGCLQSLLNYLKNFYPLASGKEET